MLGLHHLLIGHAVRGSQLQQRHKDVSSDLGDVPIGLLLRNALQRRLVQTDDIHGRDLRRQQTAAQLGHGVERTFALDRIAGQEGLLHQLQVARLELFIQRHMSSSVRNS